MQRNTVECELCHNKLSKTLPGINMFIWSPVTPNSADNKVVCLVCFRKFK